MGRLGRTAKGQQDQHLYDKQDAVPVHEVDPRIPEEGHHRVCGYVKRDYRQGTACVGPPHEERCQHDSDEGNVVEAGKLADQLPESFRCEL